MEHRYYEFDRFRIDTKRRLLLKDGVSLAIKPKALDTLILLIEHRGRLLEKQELMDRLWPDTAVEEANLTQNIFVIRKALGESPGEQRFIATVARQGYRFVADIREIEAETPPQDARTPTPGASDAGGSARMRRRTIAVCAALLVLIAGGVSALRWAQHHALRQVESIAVIPFRNVSGDAQDDFFAEGVTDAITTDLASISALRVISQQSVSQFRQSDVPLPEIAHRLGVDALILGSVARSGGRIRINVELVDGIHDGHLWAESYDRDLGDALALQGQLARAVAQAIRVRMTDAENAGLVDRQPVDPDAYALYLRGKHFLALRSDDALRKSVELYQQAVERDPTLSAAYGEMAIAYGLLSNTMPIEENSRLVKAAASAALALDPHQADAAAALSVDSQNAMPRIEALAREHPNHELVQSWYGSALIEHCRNEEGLVQRQLAVRLNPLSTISHLSLGLELGRRGRYAEALASVNQALELDPNYDDAHGTVGWIYLQQGRTREAIAEFETCARLSHDSPRMVARLAHAYGRVGRTDDARKLLQALETRSRSEVVSPIYFAHVYAGLGDFDRAFEKLNEAIAAGRMVRLNGDPYLIPLFGDARFADLGRRLNRPAPCPADRSRPQ